MKVFYASDLHLERGHEVPGAEGDLLLLAGDTYIPHHASNKELKTLKWLASHFDKTIMVMGNHEHYLGDIQTTKDIIELQLAPLVDKNKLWVLENESEIYEGLCIFGATFWTDFNRANPRVMTYAKEMMNDYRCTKNGGSLLTPQDTVRMNMESREALHLFLECSPDTLPLIILTHHAPFEERTVYRDILHYAYVNTGLEIPLKDTRSCTWVHGHTHENMSQVLHGITVKSNCHGYRSCNFSFQEL